MVPWQMNSLTTSSCEGSPRQTPLIRKCRRSWNHSKITWLTSRWTRSTYSTLCSRTRKRRGKTHRPSTKCWPSSFKVANHPEQPEGISQNCLTTWWIVREGRDNRSLTKNRLSHSTNSSTIVTSSSNFYKSSKTSITIKTHSLKSTSLSQKNSRS